MVLVPLAVKPDTPPEADAVQAKVVPLTPEVRVTSVVLAPEQIVCANGELLTFGVGFT